MRDKGSRILARKSCLPAIALAGFKEDETRSAMIETTTIKSLFGRWHGLRAAVAAVLVCGALAGCTGEQFQKGYILPPGALEQIPIGASQDQVLIVMGTPSTVATLNGEVFYYISQRA